MTTHAIAHRGCGGPLRIQEVRVGGRLVSEGRLVGHMVEDRLVCQDCSEEIEDIFDEAYTDADDIEWLVARLFRGDDITLVDEDPDVWTRKTSDDQSSLFRFED